MNALEQTITIGIKLYMFYEFMLHVHCYSEHRYYEPVYFDHVVLYSFMFNNIRYTVINSNTMLDLT